MLRELELKPVYDSAEHDLIEDLIVPLLKKTKHYLRGVGFFTSGWLKLAAQGIKELVENGGLAQIVLSPIIEEKDWKAFQLGEEARENDSIKKILDQHITDLADSLEHDTLNALAWMISDGCLEFKFAVARDNINSNYHDKVAVFTDERGEMVAIHGSFNDSIQGTLNGEAFSVFKSWEKGQMPFVEQHGKRLKELWEGGNRQFKVFTIPDAVKHKFINLRTSSTRPYSLKRLAGEIPIHQNYVIKPRLGINLHDYQEKAISSWIANNCNGIFEMATGTGKTFTSLAVAINRYEAHGRLALIILVPYLHLLSQWEESCKKFGFVPILCSGSHDNWHLEAKSRLQDFNIKAIDNICLIAVFATASSDKFKRVTKRLKAEYTMLIGDEVHGLGAIQMRNALIDNAGMRLGLSATPRRWFDDEGTQAILNYFGNVCFEFSLEEAIGKYLTPYEYRPELVQLSREEMEEYEDLSAKISKFANIQHENYDTEEKLKMLLLQRARLIASAEEKLNRLLSLLKKMKIEAESHNKNLSHILVYCAPGIHSHVLRAISSLGLRCHEFVHYISLDEREKILNDFDKGFIQIIVAIKCLDEGVDVPSTRIAFFLASTSNPKEFVQRRGRVLRLDEGKDKAIIYDFIIIPREEHRNLKREVDASLLKREMPRFAEFSSAASNEFSARAIIRDLLDHYGLLNLFDEKPWDIYHKLKANRQYMDLNE